MSVRRSGWRSVITRLLQTGERKDLVAAPFFRPRVEALEIRAVPATFTVTNANDTGVGSFRQAILDANSVGGADIINFDSTFFAVPRTITLGSDLPAVTDALDIEGAGAKLVTVSGNSAFGNWQIDAAATISGLTITDMTSSLEGGAIDASSSLTLDQTVFQNNVSTNNSTFAGGAVFSTASLTILSSNFVGNIASGGGGAVAADALLTVTNSTFTQNVSTFFGGAIYANADAVIDYTTISENTAASIGGGIFAATTPISLTRSIVANNSAGVASPDVSGEFDAIDYTIFGSTVGGTFSGSTVGFMVGDPDLAPLGDYGGSTPTMIPNAGSIALNFIPDPSVPETDQRGADRTGMRTAGAVEGQRFVVVIPDDSGSGSLRQAILDANVDADFDVINFEIPASLGLTISLLDELPTVTQRLYIDGTSQTDFAGTPIIELDGAGVTSSGTADGLTLENHFGSIVRGLVIKNFGGNGVVLTGSGGEHSIVGNYIGIGADGATDAGNGDDGVEIGSANDNTVGGYIPADGNTISGNDGASLVIGTGTGNLVVGNVIGLDAAGTVGVGNGANGLAITSNDNLIGGVIAGARNVVSGNTGAGIVILGGSGNQILGNFAGTNVAGDAAVPNSQFGIAVAANDNVIGGTVVGAGNLVSGNTLAGVAIQASGTLVVGNQIGLDSDGTSAIPNGGEGIGVTGNANTIGGTVSGAGNIISGNTGAGITLDGASNNLIAGNSIGVDISGTIAVGNSVGVSITGASTNNIIGPGSDEGANVISGNTSHGIVLTGSSVSGNVFATNYIGTDLSGSIDLGNGGHGVSIGASVSGNTVGSLNFAEGNLISGNTGAGVFIAGSGNVVSGNFIGTNNDTSAAIPNSVGVSITGSANTVSGLYLTDGMKQVISGNTGAGVILAGSNNTILGTLIGTNRDGNLALANGGYGVVITGSGNIVGGTEPSVGGTDLSVRNLIAGNSLGGVQLTGMGSSGNLVAGNYIGTNGIGTEAIGNGTNGDGVRIEIFAKSNTVGGTATGAGNLLSGHGSDGVHIGSLASGNLILGNLIGTDASGTVGLGNSEDGVYIEGPNNTVGGTVTGSANTIADQGNNGVFLFGFNASGNLITGNFIGTNASGADLGNTFEGVLIASGASQNTIGGTVAGAGNEIAFNDQSGVVIGLGTTGANASSTGNSVLGNRIHDNTRLGIDLGDNGVTPNGVNPRTFPNNGQNYPVITSVTPGTGQVTIAGTLTSAASTTYRIEFFANTPTGNEGETYLGFVNVTTNSAGVATISFTTTDAAALEEVVWFTTTATNNTTRDTSEFSAAFVAGPEVTIAPDRLPGGVIGEAYSQTLTATGGVGGPFAFTVTSRTLPPGLTLATTGELTGTPTTAGNFSFTITATGDQGVNGSQDYTISIPAPPVPPAPPPPGPPPPPVPPAPTRLFAVGAGAGGGPQVNVYNSDRSLRFAVFAYEPTFVGGVQVATGDLNGDGIDDIVTGTGAGGGPLVKVFDGATGAEIAAFFAYDPAFRGGVFVAVGDVDGDGSADIVTGAGFGGGPNVKVFSFPALTLTQSYFAYDASFTGGVRVSVGDVDGDGSADIVTGTGPGAAPHVKVFAGATGAELRSFFAYDPAFTGGIWVAAGDGNGDGRFGIMTGTDVGGLPQVRIFSSRDSSLVFQEFVFPPEFTGGVRVGASDVDGDGIDDPIFGAGPGGGPVVVLQKLSQVGTSQEYTASLIDTFFAFDPAFIGGVFVG